MKRIALVVTFVFTCLWVGAQSLCVGSYNIRYQNNSDVQDGNGWERRFRGVKRNVEERKTWKR